MTPAKKLWKEEETTATETKVKAENPPVDNRIYNIVKLLIIILLYYAIIIL
jgi:hypothetical protein